MIAFATAPGNVLGATQTPRCTCGRLRRADRPACCTRCVQGYHNSACEMRQVSLAEAAGIAVVSRFVFHVAGGAR